MATYKIGDRIRVVTKTWGEAVQDKRGHIIHQNPVVDTYVGVVKFVGLECSGSKTDVVRCTGGNVALKLNRGFQFYPSRNGENQVVTILEKTIKERMPK